MIKLLVPALPLGTLLAISYATSGQAQETATQTDDDLGAVTVTAQKLREGSIGGWLPVPVRELPRTVTVIDEEIISRQFVSSTKDILKNVAGVQIIPDNNLAGYQTPFIRGIQAAQYFEGQYSAGVVTSMPEVIGGAEVLQGFNSLQFAIDTGGGSVNYFMKRPTATNFLQTELQATNWGGTKFVVDGNMHMGPGETDGIRFVGVLDRDQTYVRDYPRKEGNGGSIMARYSGLLGIQIDVDASYWDIKNDPSNQYFFFATPPTGDLPDFDPRVNVTQDWSEHAKRHGHQLGLRLQKQFGEWRALAAVAYDRTTYVNDGCTVSSPDFVTGEASYTCARAGFGPLWDKQIRFDLTGKFNLFGLEHYAAMGWRQSGQDWKSVNERTTFPDVPTMQNIYNPRTYAPPTQFATTPPSFFRSTFDDQLFYFQDRISFGPKWDLWAGFAYVDNQGSYGSPTFPTVTLPLTKATLPTGGLVFKPNEATSYYVSYSEGVSRAELISPNDPTLVNAGELLPSIHSEAYEIGGKWTIGSRLQLNAAIFRMQQPFAITEQVQAIPPLFRRYAGGLSEYTGVSIDFHGKLTRALEIQGGFTVVDPVQEDAQDPTLEGNKTPGSARKSGSLNITWDVGPPRGFSLDAGVYYQGKLAFDAQNTYNLDGYTRVDLGASYETRWSENDLRVRLLLENALDDEFYYGFQYGLQPAAPRTLNASIVMRF